MNLDHVLGKLTCFDDASLGFAAGLATPYWLLASNTHAVIWSNSAAAAFLTPTPYAVPPAIVDWLNRIHGRLLGGERVPGTWPVSDGRQRKDCVVSAVRLADGAIGYFFEAAEVSSDERLDRFLQAIDTTNAWVWGTDAELRFTYFSPNVERIVGVPAEWHYGKTRAQIGQPDVSPEIWQEHLNALKMRRPFHDFVYRRIGPNGPQWLRTSGTPAFDKAGQFLGYRGVGADVTEEMEAHSDTRTAAERLAAAIEHMSDACALFGPDDRLLFCNRLFRAINATAPHATTPGILFEDHIRTLVRHGLMAEARGREEQWIAERLERHRNPTGPVEVERSGGRWLRVVEQPLPDGSTITIATDITELKTHAAALAQQAQLLRTTLDNVSQGIAAFDADMNLCAFNERALDLTGHPRSLAVLGTPLSVFVRHFALAGRYGPGNIDRIVVRRVTELRALTTMSSIEFNIDGRIIEMRITPVPGGGIVETMDDVTEQRQRGQALRSANEDLERRVAERTAQFATLIRAAPIAILALDPMGRVVTSNPAAERLSGRDERELTGQTLPMLDTIKALLRNERAFANVETTFTRADGVEIEVMASAAPIDVAGAESSRGSILILVDISDVRKLERQLTQSQKMEAIGRLTGGLAHDLNNLLGVVVGNLDMLSETIANQTDVMASVDAAREAALKGAQLNRQLLAFARRQPLQARSIAPMALISNMRSLLARTIGEHIEIKLVAAPNTWPIHVDAVQLESALLNLALNARDAMPSGGTLTIETSTFAATHDRGDTLPELPPGDYVVISVADTGAGIAPEHQSLIFEPFFTTKSPGQGTGLGLSMIYGFVKQSGGAIRFHSEVGAGTTMRLYFPRDNSGQVPGAVEPEPSTPTPRGRDETVLIVEDNAALRLVVVNQLKSLGYRTIEAIDAETALAILRSEPEIVLPFTDIVMPGGMDGIELARTARTIRPKLKVMYTSGFAGAQVATLSKDVAGSLLNKPYRKADLARRLRETLDSK